MMNNTLDWLQFIDHTADEYIAVTAPALNTLYERAAWAMFSILTDLQTVDPTQSWDIAVEAEDPEDLLVRWLSELNVRHQTEHLLLTTFEIRHVQNSALRASVRGERYDPQKHDILTEIKAVTRHRLSVQKQADGTWRATVLFDL